MVTDPVQRDMTDPARGVVVARDPPPLSAAGTAKEPTEEELKAFYDNHHAKFTLPEYRKIGVMAVTPETVKDQVTITDDDLKAAFEKEKDKLGKPEKRHMQQITFPDQAAAEAVSQRIQSGTDFAAIAKEQGLSDADFDLGTLTRNEMADATIADEAFKLEKDKVSSPVTGKLGKVVLLRVTEIEPGEVVTFEQAKPNLEKGVLKDRAERLILDLRDKIEDERASGSKLSEVADKLKLTYQTIEAVDRKGQAPDGSAITLPAETELLEAAFATDTGVENDPIEPKDLGIIWYEVLGETPEQLKPFDQVKDEVTKAWGEDEAQNRLAKYSQELVTSLNGGKTLDDLAKELNTEILTTEPLKRADLSVNIMPATMTQAYLLPKGGYGTAPSGATTSASCSKSIASSRRKSSRRLLQARSNANSMFWSATTSSANISRRSRSAMASTSTRQPLTSSRAAKNNNEPKAGRSDDTTARACWSGCRRA